MVMTATQVSPGDRTPEDGLLVAAAAPVSVQTAGHTDRAATCTAAEQPAGLRLRSCAYGWPARTAGQCPPSHRTGHCPPQVLPVECHPPSHQGSGQRAVLLGHAVLDVSHAAQAHAAMRKAGHPLRAGDAMPYQPTLSRHSVSCIRLPSDMPRHHCTAHTFSSAGFASSLLLSCADDASRDTATRKLRRTRARK